MLITTAVIVLAATSLGSDAPDKAYTTQYDDINIEEVLQNERIYQKYIDCLTNTGKCTPDGKTLKEHISDALQTKCEKCSEKQKDGAEKVLRFMLEKKPKDYLEIEKLYDSERMYRILYAEEAKKRGLKFPD